MAAIFPLFTYDMYSGLGGNVSTSIFAAIATAFCITPLAFIRYGPKIRAMSRYAQGDENENENEKKSDEETGVGEKNIEGETL